MIIEKARYGDASSSSVRHITVVYAARSAPVVNHLRPLITHSSPSSTAGSASWVGSDDATSGSVMAKLGEISAGHQRVQVPVAPLAATRTGAA